MRVSYGPRKGAARPMEWKNLLAPEENACVLGVMAHCKGKDNVKTRNARRKKTERLQAAKVAAAQAK